MLITLLYIGLTLNSCKDALSLDPNVHLTLIKPDEKIVKDTVYLYPTGVSDSTFVVIIRYESEKDSLQKVIDSLKNFYYPKLNPNVVNVDSSVVYKTVHYISSSGFSRFETSKWSFSKNNLSLRIDTLDNWPVVSSLFDFIDKSDKFDFTKSEYYLKSLSLRGKKLNVLKNITLTTQEKTLNPSNWYNAEVIDKTGQVLNNPGDISNVRIWFSDLNINRLGTAVAKHSLVVNFEVIINGKVDKVVYRGYTYINYF